MDKLGGGTAKIDYLERHLANGSTKVEFLIRSTYDLLLSKSNLVKWKKESDPTCPLCNEKPQTLEHVLNSCKTALASGRYTWRHNSVLDELVRIIQK